MTTIPHLLQQSERARLWIKMQFSNASMRSKVVQIKLKAVIF